MKHTHTDFWQTWYTQQFFMHPLNSRQNDTFGQVIIRIFF